jgi:hypothetical protein
MATPQPQPAGQQPIYAAELNFMLERHFARITSYFDDRFRGTDARIDGIINQISVDRQESQMRDDALLKRIQNVENTQKVMIDMQRDMMNTMQTMQQEIQSMRQEIRTGFTNLDEKVNELSMRVVKLEGGLPPASE